MKQSRLIADRLQLLERVSAELASATTFEDITRITSGLSDAQCFGDEIEIGSADSDDILAEIDRSFARAISTHIDQTIARVLLSESIMSRAREAERAAETERLGRLRLEMLGEINETLSLARTEFEVVENVVAVAVPWLGDWCVAFLFPEGADDSPRVAVGTTDPRTAMADRVIHHRYDRDAPLGVANVIRFGKPEVWPLLTEGLLDSVGLRATDRTLLTDLGWRSVVTVPLRRSNATLGALVFAATDETRVYTDDDVAICEVIASRVASSISNRRLSAQQRDIAKVLQASLLPEVLPRCDRLDVSTRYWAAGTGTEVGGDFYDLFTLDGHRSAAIIGDVCGTGPRAAAFTSLARHTIRTCLRRGDDSPTALDHLNREVLEAGTDRFITLAIVVFEHDDEGTVIEVTLAGHPHPIVVRSAGDESHVVGAPGSLIGVFDELVTATVTERLDAGDVLVLYTDGVTDVPPPFDLDTEELRSIVATSVTPDANSEVIADGIQRRIESVLPIERREDDIALLVLRIVSSTAVTA